jgi:hypothetical protein
MLIWRALPQSAGNPKQLGVKWLQIGTPAQASRSLSAAFRDKAISSC